MAIFPTITSSTSVFKGIGEGQAFFSDSPAADTLNVAVGGYLVATDDEAVVLANTQTTAAMTAAALQSDRRQFCHRAIVRQ